MREGEAVDSDDGMYIEEKDDVSQYYEAVGYAEFPRVAPVKTVLENHPGDEHADERYGKLHETGIDFRILQIGTSHHVKSPVVS